MNKLTRTQLQKDVNSCLEEFQRFNQLKNLSEASIRSYKYNMVRFFEFLKSVDITFINQVTKNVVQEFTLYLRSKHIKSVTINTHLKAVRAFLYFCMEKEYLQPFKINLIKQEEEIIETYTDDDIQKLIARPNLKKCSFVEYRDWVLINYFIETGNRLRSVVNIKVSDVSFTERRIIVRVTKNREQLITPLTKTLMNILPPYIELWGLSDDSYLFPGFTGEKINENSVKQSIARYNRKRGVSITSIHAFRHTFARNYIITGGSAFKLQSLLGHKDLEMTRHYVHLFGEDLASDIDEHSIIERIKPTSNRLTKSKRCL